MKLSYSDAQTALRCMKKYFYRKVLNLEPRTTMDYLDLGTYVHRLLAGTTKFDLKVEINANPLFFEDTKAEHLALLDEAFDIVSRHNEFWGTEKWEVLHVEESFETTLPNGHTVSYTPDLIVKDKDGQVWVVDHKTTTDSVPRELPFADLQVLVYLRGVRERYPEAAGFIFNYLRKKVPTQPRLNKTGPRKVNNLAVIDTDYDTLYFFLANEAPDLLGDGEHAGRLGELAGNNRFFYRQTVRVDDQTLDRAYADLVAEIELLEYAEGQGMVYPRSFVRIGQEACGSCLYKDLCIGELLGYDTGRIIREQYKERK